MSKTKMAISYGLRDTNLFKPIKVGKYQLLNRVAFAPCTRARSDSKYTLNNSAAEYYSQRSSRPGTLIITEATLIDARGGGNYIPPGIFKEEHYGPWKRVFEAVHKNNSFVFVQLWAIGAVANPERITKDGYPYVSASDDVYITEEIRRIAEKAGVKTHGLTEAEIKEYVQLYTKAAKKVIELGGDGVELHGANGYLPFQFLSKTLNHRTDSYGGSIENRARFYLEIVDSLIDAIGHERVGVRISPFFGYEEDKLNPYDSEVIATYAYLLSELEKRRVNGREIAYVHTVEPRPNLEATKLGLYRSSDFIFNVWNGVTIRASDYGSDYEKTKRDLEAHEKTIIGYGRYFMANPDLADRLENDWPLNEYNRSTFYSSGDDELVGYTDYPFYKQGK